jgi:DNA-binding response OmpR family regulator
MSQCVLAKLLNERGHETVCFENAEQAILAYQKEFYPLVFVDVDLPGMDGLQFCRWLRSQPEGGKTYIMLAYTVGNPDEVHGVLGAGASDFLTRPFEVGGLKLRLDVAEKQMTAFFRETELEEELRRQTEQAEGLQNELCRAGDSLAKEVEERRAVEDELAAVKSEWTKEQEALDQMI